MGAVFMNNWLFAQWPENFIKDFNPSIEILELFALTIALEKWGAADVMKNTRVTIFCDNQAVVHMVNNMASLCTICRRLIRIIALGNIKCNRRVDVKHIRSEDNILSDALSHLNFKCFWKYAPDSMNRTPDTMPEVLWPIEKIFHKDFSVFH